MATLEPGDGQWKEETRGALQDVIEVLLDRGVSEKDASGVLSRLMGAASEEYAFNYESTVTIRRNLEAEFRAIMPEGSWACIVEVGRDGHLMVHLEDTVMRSVPVILDAYEVENFDVPKFVWLVFRGWETYQSTAPGWESYLKEEDAR